MSGGPEPVPAPAEGGVGIDLVRLRVGLEAVVELLPIGPEHALPVSRVFDGLEWREVCEGIVNDVWNSCARNNRWPEVREHLERARQVIDWALHDTDIPPEVPPEYADRFNTRHQAAQAEYSHQIAVAERQRKRDAK